MKNRRYYLSFVFLLISLFPLLAQPGQEGTIFRAMQDEMERNRRELMLPGADKPFFIAYTVERARQFEIAGELGALVVSEIIPQKMNGGVKLLLGDYKMNSDRKYTGTPLRVVLPLETDYDLIRQEFWQATDAAYKTALQDLGGKKAWRKKNVLTEEAGLSDLMQVEPLQTTVEAVSPFSFDRTQWEQNVRELSAVFKEYPELFNSSVTFSGLDAEVYLLTTEGTKIRQPLRTVRLKAEAYARTEDGINLQDTWCVTAMLPQQLPDLKTLKEKVHDFARKLVALRKAPAVSEFYCGPVLFEEAASAAIFEENLLTHKGLLAYRKQETPMGVRYNVKSLADRMNMKILDNRITVKNYSTLEKYDGRPLYGAYRVDAEGVVPPKEVTLVENGILRQQLNGRIPAPRCTVSTGSARYIADAGAISYMTAPGTLHILVKNGSKPENLKKMLLKTAREDGLTYAYIVRKLAGTASRLYRVDVADGKETLVRSGDISPVVLKDLRRIPAISAKENVTDFLLDGQVLTSMIYPSAILLDGLEINKTEAKKESGPALEFPLQREKGE